MTVSRAFRLLLPDGLKIRKMGQFCFLKIADLFLFLTGYHQLGDGMRPHPVVVGALKMICTVVPSWRVIPSPDKLDKVCKDPQFKKEVPEQKSSSLTVGKNREHVDVACAA